MPSPRAALLWLAIGLAALLLTVLLASLAQLAGQSPLLAGLLLLAAIAAVAAIAVALYASRRSRRRRPRPSAPASKPEAASASFEAVQEQITSIHDRVARQALQDRAQQLASEFNRQELRVVVFGTGSAGKTSLVRALLGEVVGEVSAPMGTTEAGQSYRLELAGVDRPIRITDAPGMLEAGAAGTERERAARQLAARADLLLLVVDNDLRQSEREPLAQLAAMGKRSLLALNKSDCYPQPERDAILAQLRQRLSEAIAPEDVVAVAAAPQPVPARGGGTVRPPPQVDALLERLAAVLRAEGETLVADNILLQSQRLSEEARALIDRQRQQQAERTIRRYQWIGGGAIAVTPLPGVDMLGTAAVNAQMVMELGRIYGCELSWDQARELALSLGRTLASLGVVKGALELFASALQLTAGTYAVGKAIQGVTAAYLTRIAGKSFIEYFRQDQDWGDGGMSEVVQRQFELNRRDAVVRAFVREAAERAIAPLGLDSAARSEPAQDDWLEAERDRGEW
ncbi:MAG: GTP-binding protein [Cyanobacteria bacterium QS_8_64_29]|nr:MAG: GTP-binding protein [Cyanobacteria bacterium QS_8_64_29]